jgi:hypothetical protein
MRISRHRQLSAASAWRTVAIGSLVAVVVALAAPTTANAAEVVPPQPSGDTVQLTDEQLHDVEQLAAASDYDARTFDADAAAAAGATEQGIADFAAVLESEGWTIDGAVNGSASAQSLSVALACTGFQGYHGYYFPWGWQFGFNSCETSKLIAAVGMGAAGATVVTAILVAAGVTAFVGAIGALVTAVIAFGAAAIAACQAYSSKSAIWGNVGGTPAFSCWSQ